MNTDPAVSTPASVDDVSPALRDQDIDCWLFSLDAAATQETLDAGERARAERFHFDRDRVRFIAGHDRIRRILGRYVGLEPDAIRFEVGDHGRPRLAAQNLNFNYSRSGGHALLAVSLAPVLGADLEEVRFSDDLKDVANQSFAPAEQRALDALSADDWASGFFAAWTRKEAVLKAIGTGLATPLNAFEVAISPHAPPAIVRAEGAAAIAADWTLLSFNPFDGYQAAIATDFAAPKLHFYRLCS